MQTLEPLSLAFSARLGDFFRLAQPTRAENYGSTAIMHPKLMHAPYWAYNRQMMRMYEHLYCHLRGGLIICCVCNISNDIT